MKKIFILLILLTILSVFLMAQQCTINIPEKVGITLETGQITQQETTSQTTESIQKAAVKISSKAEMIFLIITVISFVIAIVSAISGYRKGRENTAGKILFTIFIILFLISLILYVLSLINII